MAKYKIDWSIEARLDLIDILEFYKIRNKSSLYSKKLNTKINKSIKLINKNPLIGLQSQIDSVRALITGDYQIIYEIFNNLILIIPTSILVNFVPFIKSCVTGQFRLPGQHHRAAGRRAGALFFART